MPNTLPTAIEQIIEQLGGGRIFALAFKTALYDVNPPEGSAYAVKLQLAIAPELVRYSQTKATHVIVELGWDDVYTVRVVKHPRRRGTSTPVAITVAEQSEVYADTLRGTVESMTGFVLKL